MDIKPIKTEQDYDAALAEIERLWGLNKTRLLATSWMS